MGRVLCRMLIKICNKLTVYKFKFLSDAPDDILLLPVCGSEVPGGREEGGGRREESVAAV